MFADTRYEGKVEWVEVAVGARTIRLLRPLEPDQLLEAPDVLDRNRRDDYMPYWAYLWPGAFLLAGVVVEWELTPGAEVLELGCGLGLAGLVALARGARVQFSDYDRAPLRFVERSAEAAGAEPGWYRTRLLDWRVLPEERYDLILGADLLYEKRLVPMVSDAIDRMLAPTGTALVAGPNRVATEDLPEALESRRLSAEAYKINARDLHGRPVAGTLHVIRRSKSRLEAAARS